MLVVVDREVVAVERARLEAIAPQEMLIEDLRKAELACDRLESLDQNAKA